EAYRLALEVGDPIALVQALLARGRRALYERRFAEGVALLDRTLSLSRELGDRLGVWLVGRDLAIALLQWGDIARARSLCEGLITEGLREKVGLMPDLTLAMLAGTLYCVGRPRAAA